MARLFSQAHGVSPEVRKLARDKGLTTVDATCPDVTKTHDLIREKTAEGYQIIYIGKKNHPEPEGAVGVAPDLVHLIEKEEEIEEPERISRQNPYYKSDNDEPVGYQTHYEPSAGEVSGRRDS